MYGNQKDQGPIFRFSLNGTAVTVTFGNAGEPDENQDQGHTYGKP